MATSAAPDATESFIEVAGEQLHLLKGGTGDPLVVLHHDVGNPGWLPFYQELARRFTVYVPSHPGYGRSSRPEWLRSVRDVAVVQQWLMAELGLDSPALVGLGFGGWIAAELATMAPTAFRRLVLVGAAGLKPAQGEILDQALVSYLDYARAGFHDPASFERIYDEVTTDQLEQWDIAREMTFRIAWKPYMYSQTLPHLLGGIRTPTLVVWGDDDRVVPLECGQRYVQELRLARLEVIPASGHFVEMERPAELAKLVTEFIG